MKKILLLCGIFFVPCLVFSAESQPSVPPKGEVIDRVAAVVNGRPVIESEVILRFDLVKKSKNQPKDFNRSRVLDTLINEKIIELTAEDQAIQVTDARIDNEIAEMMRRANVSDRAVFLKKIEAEQGITYDMLRIQIKQQFLNEQLMIYSIDFSPVSRKEVQEFYDKNKNRPDFVQINLKHILIRPRSAGLADEKAANEKIRGLLGRIQSGASFEDTARKESQDPVSAVKGGDLGWQSLPDLDPYFASQVLQFYRKGTLSPVIKSSFGYHIVKFLDKRVVPFEEIEPRLSNMLSFQRRTEQFTKWLERKRAESDVKIYMDGYSRPKGDNEKSAGNKR
jgi:peptidyl-prolyl cis-trans isomerase SurA